VRSADKHRTVVVEAASNRFMIGRQGQSARTSCNSGCVELARRLGFRLQAKGLVCLEAKSYRPWFFPLIAQQPNAVLLDRFVEEMQYEYIADCAGLGRFHGGFAVCNAGPLVG
jgi:hypothetical protein